MTNTVSTLVATLFALGLNVAPAHAQLSRTFVSAAIGNDANNCDRPTPCRTFQGAHNKTNSDGEIIVLDPGGYGGLTITKAISIVNDGVGEASILVSGGAIGITINAPPVAGYVNLRGITIQGIGFGGGTGVVFNNGHSLTMDNCLVRNHTGAGIYFRPPGTATTFLSISNTLIADNGADGINIQPGNSGSAGVNVVLKGVQSTGNSSHGIWILGSTSSAVAATVTDTLVGNNAQPGFRVNGSGAFTNLMITNSTSAGNLFGLVVEGAGATMQIGHSTVSGNSVTWQSGSGGSLASFGDNYMAGNGDGGGGAIPLIGKK